MACEPLIGKNEHKLIFFFAFLMTKHEILIMNIDFNRLKRDIFISDYEFHLNRINL